MEFLPLCAELSTANKDAVVKALARIGVLYVKHLWSRNSMELWDFDPALARAWGIPPEIKALSICVIQVLQSAGSLLRAQERGVRCWGWLGKDKVLKRWDILDNELAYSLIHRKKGIEQAL